MAAGARFEGRLSSTLSLHTGNSDEAPKDGERTIFVNDDGMLDTGEYDQLSAEFRHRLGLLPEEQQELSEVFRVRIGMATADQFDKLADEIDRAMSDGKRRDEMIKTNNMDQFARKHFQHGGSTLAQFNQKTLLRPLLAKSTDVEKRASLLLWMAIKRAIDGTPQRKSSSANKGLEAPIISRVWDQLENSPNPSAARTPSTKGKSTSKRQRSTTIFQHVTSADSKSTAERKTSSKRLSIKNLFRTNSSAPQTGSDVVRESLSRSQSVATSVSSPADASSAFAVSYSAADDEDNTGLLTDDVLDAIPNTELDLVNYIVAHGILKKELRDEIFCQIYCQVTNTASADSRRRGWILHALCAGCFLPSIELSSYYYGFLFDVQLADTLYYAAYTRRILRRTNASGTRFHPPSSIELKMLQEQAAIMLEVTLADGRQVVIDADSASTSNEICNKIATMLQLKDSFGFALFININGKISSLGCGLDHVMDAVAECEQLTRSQGRLESTANWKLFYKKELFTPWHSPSDDQISTELIFLQIINGVHMDEYKLHVDDVCTFVSRCLYVQHGRQLQTDAIKARMADYFPKSYFSSSNKSRDAIAKAVQTAFEAQGFSGYAVPAKFIQQEIVASASSIWPIHFSAMFEGHRVSGPPLPQNDVIIAINSGGVFLLNNRFEVLVGFHYYDLTEVVPTGAAEIRQSSIRMVAIDEEEFVFLSPNSETVARIISIFLDGLRRRSRWGVAIKSYSGQRGQGDTPLSIKSGDLIEIIGNNAEQSSQSQDEQWFQGRSDKTGDTGKFPANCIYIVPTLEKPSPDFMGLMTSLAKQRASNGDQEDGSEEDNEISIPAPPTSAAANTISMQANDNDDDDTYGSESNA